LCNTTLNKMADEYYFICHECGAYLKDKKHYLDIHQEKERYQEHENDVEDIRYQKFTSPITDAILEQYTPKNLGLDYGCGTGPVIAKILTDNGFKVKLYDPYFYPDEEYLQHQYDYIYSCEVFEHFYHPKQEIEKLVGLLKSGGRLYIMTHLYQSDIDFKNWYYRNDPTHVFIYTEKTIHFIAKKYQLTIEKITDRLVIFKKINHNYS
jgi:SAM-dependent methyltransferase